MIHDLIVPILGVLGLSGVITYILNKRKEFQFRIIDQKERRYRSILLYMDAYFEPANIKYLSSRQPDIDDDVDILKYLEMEYHEMLLYASPKVIRCVKAMIEDPNRERFLAAILAMREDLWVKRKDLTLEQVTLSNR